jgi:predicted O-methyltransferase YrrM
MDRKMRTKVTMKLSTALLICLSLIMGSLCSQTDEDSFIGIDDDRVLPMLRDLPYEHGGMNIPPADGRFLYDLIIEKGYKRGLELGTSNGYSTLWLGLAFRKTGGKLITIEIESKRAEEARENFRKAGLNEVIDSRINDAFKEIPAIEGNFDFIFMDLRKSDYIKFFELLYPRITPGGAITAHNVAGHSWEMDDFLEAIHTHPNLESTIHKTSRQGISVSIKKE